MPTVIRREGSCLVVEDRAGPAERLGGLAVGLMLLALAVGVPLVERWTGLARLAAWGVFGGGGLLLLGYALVAPLQRLTVDLGSGWLVHLAGRAGQVTEERRWPLAAVASVERTLLPGDDVRDAYGVALELRDGTRLALGRVQDRAEVDHLVAQLQAHLPASPRLRAVDGGR